MFAAAGSPVVAGQSFRKAELALIDDLSHVIPRPPYDHFQLAVILWRLADEIHPGFEF
jgi:hypothetical protein